MKIDGYRLYRYDLPFTHPESVGGRLLDRREGLLLRLEGEGETGWGEIAPLPGFSPATPSEALLRTRMLMSTAWLRDEVRPDDVLSGRWLTVESPPSVRFGIESACLDLMSRIEGQSWRSFAGGPCVDHIPVCALLSAADADLAERAAERVQHGFRYLKVKVGRDPVQAEIESVQRLASLAADGCVLRMDANRAWSLDEACIFCDAVRTLPVQFIEEPLADPDDWNALAGDCPVPLAVDETLAGRGERFLLSIPPCWVVLKPTLIGGISRSLALARTAHERGCSVVVSSMYESAVAYRALVQLASLVQAPGVAAGLDTCGRLVEDVLEGLAIPTAASIDVRSLEAEPFPVCVDCLEDVTGD